MAGELCGPGCGYCGRCDSADEEEIVVCFWCGREYNRSRKGNGQHDPYCSESCAVLADCDPPDPFGDNE